MRSSHYFKTISQILIFAMLHLCWLTSYAYAEMIPTESAVQVQDDRQRLLELLDRQEVVDELGKHGISKVEAVARVNSLTDEEVTQIAGKLDELAAGGAVSILVVIFNVAVLAAYLAAYLIGVIFKSIGCIFIDCEDYIFTPWWQKGDKQFNDLDQCYSDCNTNYHSCINSDIEDNILATKCKEEIIMCFQKCEEEIVEEEKVEEKSDSVTIEKDCDPGMESCD